MPDDFILAAENTAMSGELCYRVTETVAAEFAPWLRANPDFSVSINEPPEILGRGGIRYVADMAGLTDLFAPLILETTERGVPDLVGLRALDDHLNSGIRAAAAQTPQVWSSSIAPVSRSRVQQKTCIGGMFSSSTQRSAWPRYGVANRATCARNW